MRGRQGDSVGLAITIVHTLLMLNSFALPIAMIGNLDPMFCIVDQLPDTWNSVLKGLIRYALISAVGGFACN